MIERTCQTEEGSTETDSEESSCGNCEKFHICEIRAEENNNKEVTRDRQSVLVLHRNMKEVVFAKVCFKVVIRKNLLMFMGTTDRMLQVKFKLRGVTVTLESVQTNLLMNIWTVILLDIIRKLRLFQTRFVPAGA